MQPVHSTTLVLCLALVTAGLAFAGPPLATDDAGTVDVGKVEIELNSSYGYDKQTVNSSTTRTNTADGEIKITTGLYQDLGISLAIPYLFNKRSDVDGDISTTDGFGDMTIEIKYRFTELAGINIAIKPQLVTPTGSYNKGLSEGHWHAGVMLIASKEFADGKYAMHANFGYEHHNYRTPAIRHTTHGDLWSGSIAGEAEVVKGLFSVIDFGLATNPDKSLTELPVYALTGLRYEINDQLDINTGVKFGLTRPETDVSALYGLVLKF
ncbi:transporter [Trichlorobacter lovleyi]|uniref:transporter n=1 Tax=Trichlorobacter lovleyi TaxID=313985 RepID=UPI003D100851